MDGYSYFSSNAMENKILFIYITYYYYYLKKKPWLKKLYLWLKIFNIYELLYIEYST